MGMNNFTMEMSFEIDDEEIDDIMDAAFCGGIDYWCDEVRVERSEFTKDLHLGDYISCGGTLGLHEEAENKWHKLTKEKFMKGLQKCVKEKMPMMTSYGAIILNSGTDAIKIKVDSMGVDSYLADCIIQYAIFGELVYG